VSVVSSTAASGTFVISNNPSAVSGDVSAPAVTEVRRDYLIAGTSSNPRPQLNIPIAAREVVYVALAGVSTICLFFELPSAVNIAT
jgi:hypothetical protein